MPKKPLFIGVEGCREVEGTLWDRHFGAPVVQLSEGHEDYVRMVAVEPRTERTAVTVSADGQMRLWRSLEDHRRLDRRWGCCHSPGHLKTHLSSNL